MARRKQFWISVLCLIIAGLLVYGLHVYQLRQIQLQSAINVIVPNRFIPAGTLITADMLSHRAVYKHDYDESMITEASGVIGKEAIIPLGQEEPVLNWKLNRLHLLPEGGQSTFQIPKEYVLSISSGIRAGDRVAVYISGSQGMSGRLFPGNVVVASVKSTAYTEVEDIEQSHLLSKIRNNEEMMYATRRNASAPIDHVNLNLSEDQWLLIDRLCSGGEAKLVIAFTGDYFVDYEEGMNEMGGHKDGE